MIEVRQLTKRYGSKVAVDALTFDVRPRMVTGFLGPNGSGKSTTLRLILGLDAPDSGSATIGGRSYCGLRWLFPPPSVVQARCARTHSGRRRRGMAPRTAYALVSGMGLAVDRHIVVSTQA